MNPLSFLRCILQTTPADQLQPRICAVPTPSKESSFAERLTYLVLVSGRSRAAFASIMGVGDTTLKNYMLGNTEPRITELKAICHLTGCDLQWLVYGTSPAGAA